MLPITFLCPSINPLMKPKLGIHNQLATHEKVFTYNGQLMGSSIVPFPYEKWIIPTCSSSCTFISQNFPRLPTYLPLFFHSLGESSLGRPQPHTFFKYIACLLLKKWNQLSWISTHSVVFPNVVLRKLHWTSFSHCNFFENYKTIDINWLLMMQIKVGSKLQIWYFSCLMWHFFASFPQTSRGSWLQCIQSGWHAMVSW
jgi:hypothetical protein